MKFTSLARTVALSSIGSHMNYRRRRVIYEITIKTTIVRAQIVHEAGLDKKVQFDRRHCVIVNSDFIFDSKRHLRWANVGSVIDLTSPISIRQS